MKGQLIRKHPDAGKDGRKKEKGAAKDEIFRWHHRLKGHELEQTLGDSRGEKSLVCCSPWVAESDTTEGLQFLSLSFNPKLNQKRGEETKIKRTNKNSVRM